MKKIFKSVLCAFLSGILLSSCAKNMKNAGKTEESSSEKNNVKIICTIFPEYDWMKNIVKGADGIEVELLMKNGVDLHSFKPSAKDIINISNCDLFVYVGGESDFWIKDLLESHKNVRAVSLLEILGNKVQEEETVEGMMEEEEESEDAGEGPEYDEHVWLSVPFAREIVRGFASEVRDLKPEYSEIIEENLKNYDSVLKKLDEDFRKKAEGFSVKTVIFCDRFPFRYLTDDYGIKYYAAFKGCSAETEAGFETIRFLTEKLDELNLKNVFVIEGSDCKIAETVIRNSKSKNQEILLLDSVQSVYEKDLKNQKTYVDTMKKNFSVLEKALR